MKPLHSFAMLAAIAAVGQAFAADAVTTPVGYTTQTVLGGQFNVLGLNLHQPVVSAGVLDSSTSSSVTDTEVDFGTVLTAGRVYILEITNGDGDGVIQEVTSWTGGTLDLSVDLSAIVEDGVTTYKLRPATTVGDVFGAENTLGLQASANADPVEADVIYVPDGSGGFTQIFYSTAEDFVGWKDTVNYEDVTDFPIVYADGFLVQRRGAGNLDLVISGELKKTATYVSVSQAYTYLSGIYPAGSTLGNSNLGGIVQPSPNADPVEADVVYMPDGAGGFNQYFYSTAEDFVGWKDTVNYEDSENVELTAGMLIQRRGPSFSAKIDVPSNYSTL
jgi:hypothetical protein